MKKLFHKVLKNPEVYFLLIITMAAFKPPFTFNWIFIALAAIILIQLFVQNIKLGLFLALIIMLGNLFMLGALISELKEVVSTNNAGSSLLIGGALIWLINLFFVGLLFFKNIEIKTVKTS